MVRGILIKFIAIYFNQNLIFLLIVMLKIVKPFKLNIYNYEFIQKYFIAVASIYNYSKVSKTILFVIFGFIDLKLLQIYSNSPFEI